MLGPIVRISNQFGRNVMRNNVRHGSHGGVPGENLPFDMSNKLKLTFNMIWFIGSGLAAPFIIVWHQVSKP